MTDFANRGALGLKQPNPSKPRKGMRKVSSKKAAYRASSEGKAAREYMGLVKQLPCAVCSAAGPSDAHHVFHGRYGTRKASDFDIIPLCKRHHQDGPDAIHNIKETWAARHGPDYGYIEQTRKLVGDLFD